jgi:hypothetical protein
MPVCVGGWQVRMLERNQEDVDLQELVHAVSSSNLLANSM